MDELLTIEELAVILKVPKSWIYSRTSKKEIPHIKVGRHLRFQKEKVFEGLGITKLDSAKSGDIMLTTVNTKTKEILHGAN